ncbi:cyclic nucleotide-binding domain-containing protein [Phorcysia thermohydrogeniphila]|uniref:Cyclic nucleotide-binding domain-containing protein n=1 Tax=Phorcysia thermohydrogeniphila TaxID=936138 RepID=A0A4R1GE97_9BACT|nr:cyclic nucleotide-binding domain-containing protein [Phorcysia thermohydrogeniphila]TCK06514.1 Cyclic nucleotide-binding domain-containing protein [Phorcysia thermohydrogeniphila]
MVKSSLVEECKLFSSFSPEEKEVLSQVLEDVSFEKGCLLFDEGDPADFFYFLREGRVALFRSDNFGRWNKIAVVYGGTPLGECAFLLGCTHSLKAVAERDVRALKIDRESFLRLKSEEPALAVKLLEAVVAVLSTRLKEEDRRYAEICGFFNTTGGRQWSR